MKDLVLACDLGTGGLKGSVISPDGSILISLFQSYKTFYPNDAFHEQRPNDWWRALVEVVTKLIKVGPEHGFSKKNIRAISLSGHSLGCIPVNVEGDLLQDQVPIWSDGRSSNMATRFFQKFDETTWYLRTGNGFPAPLYTLFKIMWLRQHQPNVFSETYKILGTKDYLNALMTGNMVTEPSYASGSGAYELLAGCYDQEILAAADIPENLLPDIIPSASIVGNLTQSAANELNLSQETAVIAGGVDNSCMALGAKTFTDGDIFSSMGSSSWLTISTSKPLLDPSVRSYAFAHLEPNQFISATSIFSSGTTIDWTRDILHSNADHKASEALAANSPAGSNGLLMVPTLGGGTSLEGGAEVRGAYLGLSLQHNRSDLMRSSYEGVAMGLRVALDELRRMTTVNSSLIAVGGGAKSDFWRQIFADVLNIEVEKTSIDQEAASIGAAAVAFRALGIWNSYEPVRDIHQSVSKLTPQQSTQEIYLAGLKAYREAAKQQQQLSSNLVAYRKILS